MVTKLISIALIVSALLFGLIFLFISLIYKKVEKRRLKITNTFPFETIPEFKSKEGILNYFIIFSLLLIMFPFIFYSTLRFNSFVLTMVVMSTLAAFCLGALPFVSLNKLREHFYLVVGALVSILALLAIEGYYLLKLYNLYLDNYYLIGGIVSLVLAFFVLILIINPKLFNLKNDIDEQGNSVRKKFISLAFTEWILYFFFLASLVPLLLSSL